MASAHVCQTSNRGSVGEGDETDTAPDTSTSFSSTLSKYSGHIRTAFYSLIAVVTGAGCVLQGGVNITLAQWIGTPLRSGFISFFVGTLCLSVSLCIPTKDRISTKSLINNLVTDCKSEKRNLLIFVNTHQTLNITRILTADIVCSDTDIDDHDSI